MCRSGDAVTDFVTDDQWDTDFKNITQENIDQCLRVYLFTDDTMNKNSNQWKIDPVKIQRLFPKCQQYKDENGDFHRIKYN